MSIFGRMVQGVADSLICVAIPSVVAIEFPQKSELYQGYIEMAMGVGLTLGPIFSSALYNVLGYACTFYFFAVFITVFGFGSVCFMPSRLDRISITEDYADLSMTRSVSSYKSLKRSRGSGSRSKGSIVSGDSTL